MWLFLLLLFIVGIYYLFFKPLNYWKERNVPYVRGIPIFGSMWPVVSRKLSSAEVYQKLCHKNSEKRYFGIHNFTSPTLIVQDPELIKKIMVKEFDTFPEHRLFIPADVDPLWGNNLFAMKGGERWHEMRATLSPSFTTNKLKTMFTLLTECSEHFTNYYLQKGKMVKFEMKDVFGRFTNDVIATVGFGVKCNSLKEPYNEFYMMGRRLSNFEGWRRLVFMLNIFIPTVAKISRLPMFEKSVATFFKSLVRDTIKLREENNIVRPDMLHLLMEARKGQLTYEIDSNTLEAGFAAVKESIIDKNKKRRKFKITDEDITAQVLLFFFAGFESVSIMMSYAVYELALHPEYQQRLRNEVDGSFSKCKNTVTYDALMSMKYLDQVISETLRKWPPFIGVSRRNVRPYEIEPNLPKESVVSLNTGTTLFVPIYAIHRNAKYYPNPDKFDPERFSDENKNKIVPFTYLPFGAGPRNCIGSRFALIEGKLILAEIIRKFELIPIKETPIPVVLSKKNVNPIPDVEFWIGLIPRTDKNLSQRA